MNAGQNGTGTGIPEAQGFVIAEPASLAADYTIEGDFWQPTGQDPQIIFEDCGGWDAVRVNFAEPIVNDSILTLYYSDGAFDRFHRAEEYLMGGTETALVRVPAGSWDRLRLDIRTDFRLESMEAVPREPLTAAGAARKLMTGGGLLKLLLVLFILWAGILPKVKSMTVKAKTGKAAGGRTVWLDAVRALAAVMVVALHVAEPEALALPHDMKRYLFLQALCVFCINCNLLFVLISGALLLPWREENFTEFLKKRLWKVVLPLLVYACFYVFGMCASADGPWFLFKGYVRQVSSDTVFMGPHLRLMYVIISLYLIAWFLRFLLKSMTEREEKILAGTILVLRVLATLALEHRVPVGVMFYLADWPGLFLMGYFLTRDWMRKYDPAIIAAGAGAFAYSVYLVTVRDDFMNVVANTSSLMLFMSSALFVLFLRAEQLYRTRRAEGTGACGANAFLSGARAFVSALSRQSYSILLIHFFVLHAVLRRGLMREGLPMTAELLMMFLLCLVISWIIAFVVDNTVIAAVDHVLRRNKEA